MNELELNRSQILTLTNLDIPGMRRCRWCGGRVPPKNKFYCSQEHSKLIYEKYIWEKVREAVWKRDERRCQFPIFDETTGEAHICGIEVKLYESQCHHILPFRVIQKITWEELRRKGPIDLFEYKRLLMDAYVDKRNLRTVCIPHHGKYHTHEVGYYNDRNLFGHPDLTRFWALNFRERIRRTLDQFFRPDPQV